MQLGFSLSPGGLLLPYHLGALASLSHHGYINDGTDLAGSSAGAIAVASHGCGVDSRVALDASIRISSNCNPMFLSRGKLMPNLDHELDTLLSPQAHEIANDRKGIVGLAHYELYPELTPRLTTHFDTRKSLIDAVCDSSMFPYFTSNRPCRIVVEDQNNNSIIDSNNNNSRSAKNNKQDWFRSRRRRQQQKLPPRVRVAVDGVFTEPFWRFGCPDFNKSSGSDSKKQTDKTIMVSVIPRQLVNPIGGLVLGDDDVICPNLEPNLVAQISKLCLMATTCSIPKSLIQLYDSGWMDAERWVHRYNRRMETQKKKALNQKRKSESEHEYSYF